VSGGHRHAGERELRSFDLTLLLSDTGDGADGLIGGEKIQQPISFEAESIQRHVAGIPRTLLESNRRACRTRASLAWRCSNTAEERDPDPVKWNDNHDVGVSQAKVRAWRISSESSDRVAVVGRVRVRLTSTAS
jgi:hypothetical protein